MRVPVRGESSVHFLTVDLTQAMATREVYVGHPKYLPLYVTTPQAEEMSRQSLACSTKLATVRGMMALQVPFQ